jgi:DNA-binding NarL/FixJ family response regulator
MPVSVAIFEDSKPIREAISMLINGTNGLHLAGAFPDCNNLLSNISQSNPEVVLMDIEMPGMNGIEAVKILKQKFPSITVIMQTVFEDEDKIFNAICNGASGYLLKDTAPSRLMEAILEASHGGAPMSPSIAKKTLHLFQKFLSPYDISKQEDYRLTPRETEILQWLVKGYSYKMIASACNIGFDTVRTHIRNIYNKLHVASMTEAVAKAIRERIV